MQYSLLLDKLSLHLNQTLLCQLSKRQRHQLQEHLVTVLLPFLPPSPSLPLTAMKRAAAAAAVLPRPTARPPLTASSWPVAHRPLASNNLPLPTPYHPPPSSPKMASFSRLPSPSVRYQRLLNHLPSTPQIPPSPKPPLPRHHHPPSSPPSPSYPAPPLSPSAEQPTPSPPPPPASSSTPKLSSRAPPQSPSQERPTPSSPHPQPS